MVTDMVDGIEDDDGIVGILCFVCCCACCFHPYSVNSGMTVCPPLAEDIEAIKVDASIEVNCCCMIIKVSD